MRVKLEKVCKRIYAGGDVPKDRFSEIKTEKYPVPIFANAEKDNGLYGYTDKAKENELSITVAARGTIGFTVIRREPFFPAVRLITVVPDTDKVSERYLFYVLKNCKPQSSGTSIPQLTVPDIKKNSLELCSLHEQEKIADILDKVNEIITNRKLELRKWDNLIKARFVELFGDPVLNPMRWESKTVIDECECMVPGRDKPKSFTGNIPWITIEDLKVNGVTLASKSGLGLTEMEIDEVNRKVIPEGSVIMSCVGNLGICSIAGREMIINQQLHSFQCKERINNVFLMYCLGYRTDYMKKWASNTTVLYMNKSICNSIPIIVPPLELQEQFADFVKQVAKSKFAVQSALDEAQLLFDSLMQEFFG